MKKITLKDGRKLKPNSYEFMVELLEDMRKTSRSRTMVLDMSQFACKWGDKCYACAGGSAVIHGMGGKRSCELWSDEEWSVACWCNAVRQGWWDRCKAYGWPVPKKAQKAYSDAMQSEAHPDFWEAWERFVEAWK